MVESYKVLNRVSVKCMTVSTSKCRTLLWALQRDQQDLTPEQCLNIQKFLLDIEDIFSKGDFDLGLFEEIQHRIYTGNALPIKPKLGHTPLGFQIEEKEHLKCMLDKRNIDLSASEWSSAPVLYSRVKSISSLYFHYNFHDLKTSSKSYIKSL